MVMQESDKKNIWLQRCPSIEGNMLRYANVSNQIYELNKK